MKNIDHLIESVFEGQDLDQGLTASELREVELLKTLKSDLKQLRDVPECQLTVDHLRRAMLNQPVPVAKKNPFRLWTWVPVAAAAALALLMVNRPAETKLSPTESGMAHPSTSLPVEPIANKLPDASQNSESVTPVRSEAPLAEAKRPAARETVRTRYVARRTASASSQPEVVALMTRAVQDTADQAVGGNVHDLSEESSAKMSTASVPAVSRDSEPQVPVVIVGDTSDPETGAAEAREISRPSDVVFGG